jgi:hypothetical protein
MIIADAHELARHLKAGKCRSYKVLDGIPVQDGFRIWRWELQHPRPHILYMINYAGPLGYSSDMTTVTLERKKCARYLRVLAAAGIVAHLGATGLSVNVCTTRKGKVLNL